ncbi:AAA family ATPase [Shewanella algae]|nr:AAA family ATPase [Shewanella algae]
MKIKELELENFKVFKSQVFKFKRITVLAGANSAGKSTV